MVEFNNLFERIKITASTKKRMGSYWGNGLAGEVGEACNLIKKQERDNLDIASYEMLGGELADAFIYLVLTAKYYEIDLEGAIVRKLNEGNKDERAKKSNGDD